MFLIALGWIMGAAIVDMTLIFGRAVKRWRETAARPGAPARRRRVQGWRRVHTVRLVVWSICWGAAVVAVGHLVLHQPVLYLVVALVLVCVFALVNGISLGISDSNPISSAFVVSIVILAAIGLKDPAVGLMAGTVLLVSTSVACDMQQDRSTGARLGTNRVMQFRYQAAGIFVGALLAVAFARLFMAAYPVLLLDQTAMTEGQQPAQWNAAMTFKFVGILKSLTDDKPYQRTAIWIGVGTGLLIELVRKLVFASRRWLRYKKTRIGRAVDFVLDSTVLSSPYALSFGGFVNLPTSLWLGAGGVVAGLIDGACGARASARDRARRRRRAAVGHDRHVAVRRRPDRRRRARRARARPDRARRARRRLSLAAEGRCSPRSSAPPPARDREARADDEHDQHGKESSACPPGCSMFASHHEGAASPSAGKKVKPKASSGRSVEGAIAGMSTGKVCVAQSCSPGAPPCGTARSSTGTPACRCRGRARREALAWSPGRRRRAPCRLRRSPCRRRQPAPTTPAARPARSASARRRAGIEGDDFVERGAEHQHVASEDRRRLELDAPHQRRRPRGEVAGALEPLPAQAGDAVGSDQRFASRWAR